MIVRGRTYLFVIACLMMAFMVYFFENKVRSIKDEIAKTEEKLARYDEDLKVLEAEWSYLNNPQRLNNLSAKVQTDMASPAKTQYTNLKDLPTREVMTAKADSEIQIVP